MLYAKDIIARVEELRRNDVFSHDAIVQALVEAINAETPQSNEEELFRKHMSWLNDARIVLCTESKDSEDRQTYNPICDTLDQLWLAYLYDQVEKEGGK
jgi:hypothetical protein